MSLRQTQVRLLAESGVEYLRFLLMQDADTLADWGYYYDNEYELCGHQITDGTIAFDGSSAGEQSSMSNIDYRDVGRFSVIAPLLSDDGILTGEELRYGLEDESAKLNLRWVMRKETEQPGYGRELLIRLPGITEDLADAILDWMDEDNEPREYGAEDEYYSQLDPPYYTRNAVPDSLDGLLLVRGMTPKLLYGLDWNRNGIVDLGEPDETTLDEFNVSDGSLNLGLISLLTLDSKESVTTPDGLPKINVNMEDIDELRTQLEERFENESWVEYIVQYRQGQTQDQQQNQTQGQGESATQASTGAPTGQSSSNTSNTSNTLTSILDLVGGQGSPFADSPSEMSQDLPELYDNLMLSDTSAIGRINLNQASRTVLEFFVSDDAFQSGVSLALTDEGSSESSTDETQSSPLTLDIVEGILAERISDPALREDNDMRYPFWLYTRGIVSDLAALKQLEPLFCCQGAVFKANVVGRFDEKSPTARLEVWLDASDITKPPKILRYRDITNLGPGYAAELLGTVDSENYR